MDGFVYVIGGRAGAMTIYGDTWRSPDGVNWELMSNTAGWGKRCYAEVEMIGGRLVLMGGQGMRTFHNDVWHSEDGGRTWDRVSADAPWGPRAGHHTITVDGVIYLFAGGQKSFNREFYPELWVSSDLGESWELRARLPDDMGRAGMQVVEIDGILYFMGGDHDRPVFLPKWAGRRNDIWASSNAGDNWELLGYAPWAARTGQQCVVVDHAVICIGGHARGPHRFKQVLMHDLWSWDPARGMAGWERLSDNVWGAAEQPARSGKSDFMFEVFDGKLWTLGGDREVLSPWPQDNDVWVADLPPAPDRRDTPEAR
jgi:hypothetical protein